MRRLLAVGLVLSLGSGVSCKQRSQGSGAKEAPDDANKPSTLGLGDGPFKWDDLKNNTSGSIEHPWSDTYWPLNQRGIALRWMADGQSDKVSPMPKTLYAALKQTEAAELKDPGALNYLSPGEKYDLLVSSTKKIPADVWAKLKASEDKYNTSVAKALEPLVKKEEGLRKQQADVSEKYAAMTRKVKDLSEAYNKLVAEKKDSEAKKIQDEIKSLEPQLTAFEKQWDDLQKQLNSNGFEQRKVAKTFNQEVSTLAEEVEKYLPMTGEGWKTWAYWEASDAENLNWMGLCHGWAPAAIYEKKPVRSVLVEKDGKKILFTEGDIRGLLTKMWADQAPVKNDFVGARRCNADTYDVDRRGRILDGTVCLGKKDGSCDLKSGGKPIYVKVDQFAADGGYIIYTDAMHDTSYKIALRTSELGNQNFQTIIFDTIDDFKAYRASKGEKRPASSKDAVVQLTNGCRDTNPMTLHLALTKLIKEKQQGFVIDVTRTSEVWNQPVYRYEMSYLPIALNKKDPSGKTLSPAGEPAPLTDIEDAFKDYRAEGTEYLVTVQAQIYYGMENGPMIDFDRDATKADDHHEVMKVTYTLELDKDQNVIGGEWGGVPLPGDAAADDEAARQLIGGDAPDFIWYYTNGSKPENKPYDSKLVEKIHTCSLQAASGKMKINEMGDDGKVKAVDVEFVNCKI